MSKRTGPICWLKQAFFLPRMPFWMISILLVGLTFSWLVVAVVLVERVTHRAKPRVHIFQDMGKQPRYNPQAASTLFADGRAMRPQVPGTVAQGQWLEPGESFEDYAHKHLGYRVDDNLRPVIVEDEQLGRQTYAWYEGMPPQIEVSMSLLRRGQDMFNAHCMTCHGYNGRGEGPTSIRASELVALDPVHNQWTPPANLLRIDGGELAFGPQVYQDGRVFHVISHGVGSMAGYAGQISVEDRWAIVAYIRAMQMSQTATLDDIPQQERERLR